MKIKPIIATIAALLLCGCKENQPEPVATNAILFRAIAATNVRFVTNAAFKPPLVLGEAKHMQDSPNGPDEPKFKPFQVVCSATGKYTIANDRGELVWVVLDTEQQAVRASLALSNLFNGRNSASALTLENQQWEETKKAFRAELWKECK